MNKFALALFALFIAAASVSAQNTPGRLTGLVTDAQGAILPGVTVTATSPALIGGQNAVTQSDGKFLFPALPTGQYKLVFELSGFQKLTREASTSTWVRRFQSTRSCRSRHSPRA